MLSNCFLLLLLLPSATSSSLTSDFIDNLFGVPWRSVNQTAAYWWGELNGFEGWESDLHDLSNTSLETLNSLMFTQMLSLPELSNIYIGLNNTSWHAYSRNAAGHIEHAVKPRFGTDINFSRIDQRTSEDKEVYYEHPDYDPTGRPWYKVFTKDVKKAYEDTMASPNNVTAHWSDVYVFEEAGNPLGVTLSCPFFDGVDLVSVLGIDFRLTVLEDKLNSLSVEIQNENENLLSSYATDFWIFEKKTHATIATSFDYKDVITETRNQTFNGYEDGDNYNRTIITDKNFFGENNNDPKIRQIVDHFKKEHSLTKGESSYWFGHGLNSDTLIRFLSDPEDLVSSTESIKDLYKSRTVYNHFVKSGNEYILTDDEGQFVDVSIIPFSPKEGDNKPEWFIVAVEDTREQPNFIQNSGKGKNDFLFCATMILLTCTISLICFIFTIYYRNSNVIRLSQPTFLALLPVGSFGMGLSLIPLIGNPTPLNCPMQFYFTNVFFTFTFSCFLWKIHRAWRIAKAIRYMKKIRFTNADVYKCVGVVVLLDATLQGLATSLQYLQPGTKYRCAMQQDWEGGSDPESCLAFNEYYGCFAPHYVSPERIAAANVFSVLSMIMKGGLIGFGLAVCYRTKSFSAHYAESTALLLTCYTFAICGLIFLFSRSMYFDELQNRAGSQVKIYSFMVCFNVLFPQAMLFLPRMTRLIFYGDITKEELMERTRKMKLTPSGAKTLEQKTTTSTFETKSTFGKKSTSTFEGSPPASPVSSPSLKSSESTVGELPSTGHSDSADMKKYGVSGAFKGAFMRAKKFRNTTGPKRGRGSSTRPSTDPSAIEDTSRSRASSTFSSSFAAMSSDPDEMVGFVMYDNYGEAVDKIRESVRAESKVEMSPLVLGENKESKKT